MTRANIDNCAYTDPRIRGLARRAGWANHFEAIGRLGAVWLACTNLGRNHLTPEEIADAMEWPADPAGLDGLVNLLVQVDLATPTDDDGTTYYVRGSDKRCGWLEASQGDQQERARRGGLARVKSAKRNAKGQLLPAGLDQQEEPAQSSASSRSVSGSVSVSVSKISEVSRDLAERLRAGILEKDSGHRLGKSSYWTEARQKTWAETVDRILRLDGKTETDVGKAIDWLFDPKSDHRFVVQSPGSLRDKLDRIRHAMKQTSIDLPPENRRAENWT